MEKEVKSAEKIDFVTTMMNCLTFILAVALKPINALKSKIKDYSDFKGAGILVLFVALAEMIVNLLGTMISTIFVKQTSFFSGETKLIVSFKNLKDLNYFDLIVKNLFWSVIIIAAVAGVYYVVSMIMKKNANYFRLAAITAVSFVPLYAALFVSIIIAYIYAPLSAFVVFAAFIYSFLIFIHAIDNEVEFKDADFKVFFHVICLTAVFIVAYYVLNNSVGSMASFGSLLK